MRVRYPSNLLFVLCTLHLTVRIVSWLVRLVWMFMQAGTGWRSWLKHYAASWQVAGSILDGVDSTSDRNEYQEYFLDGKGGRFVRLTTSPLSCADCLNIWAPQPPGTVRACSSPVQGVIYLCVFHAVCVAPFTSAFFNFIVYLLYAIDFIRHNPVIRACCVCVPIM